jgi:hypothetical protein
MQAEIKNVPSISYNGDTVALTIELDSWCRQDVYEAVNAISTSDKPFILSIEKQKKRRSLNANAYCWILCQKIAEKVGTTKEIVYRKNIREVGSFEVVEVSSAAVPRFIERWHSNGLGWIAEPYSEENGFTSVIAYYGSSTYDTHEMSRLIDALVTEAKELGIETMPDNQLDSLIANWRKE